MEDADIPRKKIDKKYVTISRIKRRFLKHVWATRFGLLVTVALVFYLLFLLIGNLLGSFGIKNYLSLGVDFLFTPEKKVSSIEGRTNVLILGKGGEGHDAPDLTDTAIFASVSHTEKGITLVSLPRDIWVPSLRAKLNSVYYWGNERQEGGGIILAKSVVEEITGQPVHYGVVIDFSGYKEIVDVLGGIEIDVQTAFKDKKYPILGKENDECDGDPEFKCRYQTVSFDKGTQTMDGERALQFVRSRNAEGDEGTDIARAGRQLQVINAIKKKVMTPAFALSPKKVSSFLKVVNKIVETDIPSSAGAILARRFLDGTKKINSYVLNDGLLVNPPQSYLYDNLYVFIPVADSWEEVHKWIEGILP